MRSKQKWIFVTHFLFQHLSYMQSFFRSSCPEAFCKKVFLEISQNSQENTCARISLLTKFQAWDVQFFIKNETLAQAFLCEFCEISKNAFLNTSGGCFWFFTGSSFFVFCPLFSFNLRCVLNELKNCEEFSLVSIAYYQSFAVPLSYIDISGIVYLFQSGESVKYLPPISFQ